MRIFVLAFESNELPYKNSEMLKEVFLNGIFLIYRKSSLLIKAPYKTFCSPSILEENFPNLGSKIYDHTVNELGYVGSELILSNTRSF